MDNNITINIEELLKVEDNSITDSETIRQIALWGIKNKDNRLYCKIKKGFEYAGLYPYVMNTFDIIPEIKK